MRLGRLHQDRKNAPTRLGDAFDQCSDATTNELFIVTFFTGMNRNKNSENPFDKKSRSAGKFLKANFKKTQRHLYETSILEDVPLNLNSFLYETYVSLETGKNSK